jgi:hypothetical protein
VAFTVQQHLEELTAGLDMPPTDDRAPATGGDET